jgi:hypothetical protein
MGSYKSKRQVFEKNCDVFRYFKKRHYVPSCIFFETGKALSHLNYMEVVILYARSYRKMAVRWWFHRSARQCTVVGTSQLSAEWHENFVHSINNHRWSLNGSGLDLLDYYVWETIVKNRRHEINLKTMKWYMKDQMQKVFIHLVHR